MRVGCWYWASWMDLVRTEQASTQVSRQAPHRLINENKSSKTEKKKEESCELGLVGCLVASVGAKMLLWWWREGELVCKSPASVMLRCSPFGRGLRFTDFLGGVTWQNPCPACCPVHEKKSIIIRYLCLLMADNSWTCGHIKIYPLVIIYRVFFFVGE